MSQSTSTGSRGVVRNRDPRYARQRFRYPSSSEDEIECVSNSIMENPQTENLSENVTCPMCLDQNSKSFTSVRGLKIHISKMHKNIDVTNRIVQGTSTNDSVQTGSDFSQIISSLKRTVRVLKYVPKSARNLAASKLASVINNCLEYNNQESWEKLFLFAYNGLQVPSVEKSKSLTTRVKTNLYNPIVSNVYSNVDKPNKVGSLEKRVESKVAEFDIRGAIRILSSTDTIAPVDAETLSLLIDKHPSPSRNLLFPIPSDDIESLQVNTEDVRKAIFSFPCGSSAGLDGISPQILKDLISKSAKEGGTQLLLSITQLCNLMLRGQVVETFCPYLYGASLLALGKKDGGIRPIAVGSVFRRLSSKIGCSYVRDHICSYLQPNQLGFATQQGGEAIVHAVRSFVSANKNSNTILFKIDYLNAFNMLERDSILEEVKSRVPSLFKYLQQCYQNPSHLLFGEDNIPSMVGAQQGDPAGPLIFSLALHPIISKLKSSLNLWYLDDGILGGSPDDVIQDLQYLIEEAKKIGLQINSQKCELFYCSENITFNDDKTSDFEALLPGFRTIDTTELSILGSPVCKEAFESHFDERFEKVKLLLCRLSDKISTHVAYFLMKNCTTIPKLTYSTRTTPIWMYPDCMEKIDSYMKTTMEKIFNTQLSQIQWTQATLPVNCGGLGLRKIEDISLPAFISSANGVKPLVSIILKTPLENVTICHLNEAMDTWNVKYKSIPTDMKIQKEWNDIIVKDILEKDVIFTNNVDIARFTALQCKEAGAWLEAIPAKQIGTLLNNRAFRICVCLRLGCTLCRPHPCICGIASVDSKGIHPLNCQKSMGRFSRHASINNVLKRALVSVDIPCQLEPTGLTTNNNIRPDGVSIVPWAQGKNVLWDVTCTDTLAPSNISRSVAERGSAAEFASKNKRRKYAELCDQYEFIGFAVETMGVLSEEARRFVKEIGSMLVMKSGMTMAGKYLLQRISIEIQRGNAASVIGACPATDDLEEVFYL